MPIPYRSFHWEFCCSQFHWFGNKNLETTSASLCLMKTSKNNQHDIVSRSLPQLYALQLCCIATSISPNQHGQWPRIMVILVQNIWRAAGSRTVHITAGWYLVFGNLRDWLMGNWARLGFSLLFMLSTPLFCTLGNNRYWRQHLKEWTGSTTQFDAFKVRSKHKGFPGKCIEGRSLRYMQYSY